MMDVLTSWYPPHIKPTRPGWYLTRPSTDSFVSLSLWLSGTWYWEEGDPMTHQDREWRGLAFDPGAAVATASRDVWVVKVPR